MFCPHCGANIADNSVYCPYCNGNISEEARASSQNESPYYIAGNQATPPKEANPLNDPRGMKWFKFIIYVQLFLAAIMNTLTAVSVLSGNVYSGKAEQVYSTFPKMKGADIFYGVCLLAIAAFAIFVRFRLAGFYRNGPAMYYSLQVASLVVSVGYVFIASLILGVSFGSMMNVSSSASLVTSIVMLVVNINYFGKRSDLFVN